MAFADHLTLTSMVGVAPAEARRGGDARIADLSAAAEELGLTSAREQFKSRMNCQRMGSHDTGVTRLRRVIGNACARSHTGDRLLAHPCTAVGCICPRCSRYVIGTNNVEVVPVTRARQAHAVLRSDEFD
jgi:hypothetical protein